MNWQEVVENPSLQNLPFKIETDENGKVIMSAVKIKHSLYQGEISFLMRTIRQDGLVMSECAIKTPKGTKVADVAWASIDRVMQIREQTEALIAPEVCVEVLSSSNTTSEMQEKRELYFERGALEVWICQENGEFQFFNVNEQLNKSEMFPDFPNKIEI
jgi:Uma2 family endonuclease